MPTMKSSGDLIASIGTDMADNNAGLISAEDVRHNMEDIAYSVNKIVASGDTMTEFPFYNNVRARSSDLATTAELSGTGIFIAESGIQFPNANTTVQIEPFLGISSLDHGSMAGLGDDDHPHYYNITGVSVANNVLQGNVPVGHSNWINASGYDNIGFKFVPVSPSGGRAVGAQGTDQEIYTSGTLRFGDGSSLPNAKGHAKAWVRFDGNNSQTNVDIYTYHNVSGVGKVGAGKYEIHFNSGIFDNPKHILAVATANGTTASGSLEDMDVNSAVCVLRGPVGGNDHRQLATLAVQDEAGAYVDAKLIDVVFFGLEPGESSGVDTAATFVAGTDYFGG